MVLWQGKEHHLSERVSLMNSHLDIEEQIEMDLLLQMAGVETDLLAQCGFSPEEIVALFRLRQWYQMGGSDRVSRSCATWSFSSSSCSMARWSCKQGYYHGTTSHCGYAGYCPRHRSFALGVR